MNFTDRKKFTRITDWKLYPGNTENVSSDMTTITIEEPCSFEENDMNRFYPIISKENKNKFKIYKEKVQENMTFIGRCGTYQYLDMDESVAMALKITKNFLSDKFNFLD